MADRLFDPNDLMSQEVEANATKREPLPVGEVNAQITEIKFESGMSKAKPGKESRPWCRMDATCEITDPDYLKGVGDGTREKAVVFVGIMVDMKDGRVAVGADRNVELGRFREAAGVNGQPLQALIGQYVRLSIVHEPHYQRPDETVHKVANFAAPQ